VVSAFKNKGLKTHFKTNPTPYKNEKSNTDNKGAQPVDGYVPFDL
jgi:hypothetical protein